MLDARNARWTQPENIWLSNHSKWDHTRRFKLFNRSHGNIMIHPILVAYSLYDLDMVLSLVVVAGTFSIPLWCPCWVSHRLVCIVTASWPSGCCITALRFSSLAREWPEQFFPTCQVRVVRFYQSCSPPPPPRPPPPPHPPPPPRSPDPSVHSRTSTASSRSQWALQDLNRDFHIAVATAGPQPRLPDRSVHCRTSTATSRSQWALPDLNGKNVRKDVR